MSENSSDNVEGSSKEMEDSLSVSDDDDSSLFETASSSSEETSGESCETRVGRLFLRIDGELVGWKTTCDHYRG